MAMRRDRGAWRLPRCRARGPRAGLRRDRPRARGAPPRPPPERRRAHGSDAVRRRPPAARRRVAARAVASPVAWRSLPSMRPGGSQAAKRGSRTARSARGSRPSADASTSSSARGRRVRGAERAEHDVDGVVRLVVEHLEPSELREDRVDVGPFACGREGVRDRSAHRLLHHGALVGVDHSSLPSSRSRRAMMLRCTSAVPP